MAHGIVKARWVMLAIFLGLTVLSVFSIGWVNIEDDVTSYLQEDTETKQGLNILNREFLNLQTARVMIDDISVEEAANIAERLRGIDGVNRVEHDDTEKYYRDGSALYNLTFASEDGSEEFYTALDEVKQVLRRYEPHFYTDSMAVGNDIMLSEMAMVVGIVAVVVLSVLIFTSSTYGEVLVLIATFIMAAVTNMGTNFVLGTISLISNAVTLVLQLALSVDYAIIYCNRYKEEHEYLDVEEAAIVALSKAIPEISASSLTTIAGLLAMTFMQFRIGYDMGIVLMKSIVFSLLTVFLFMPAMLVFCGRFMDRTKHKNFVPKVAFLGKFAYATRFIIPPIFIILVVLGMIGYNKDDLGYSISDTLGIHKSENDLAYLAINEKFGENNYVAVFVPSGDYEKDLAFGEELLACKEVNTILSIASIEAKDGYRLADKVTYKEVMEIADVDETLAKAIMAFSAAGNEDYRTVGDELENYSVPIIDLFMNLRAVTEAGTYELEPDQQAMIDDLYDQLTTAKLQLESADHSCIALFIDLPVQSEETFDFIKRVHAIAEQYYPADSVVMTGNAVAARDFSNTFVGDNRTVSTLSIVLVMIILLLTFRSIGLPILLIMVIQGSIWWNFAIPGYMGTMVFFMSPLIVGSIQMGANIDYAIVISSRYTELREGGMPQKDAIIDTLNLAFPTVITSGTMMVAAGLLIGFRVSQGIISGMGYYVGTGSLISLILVNFALPQILIFGDGFVRATSIRIKKMIFGENATKILRRAAAGALAVAVIFTLVLIPLEVNRAQKSVKIATKQNEGLLDTTSQLHDLAAEIEEERKSYDATKLGFAEHLLTDRIGAEQLEEGRAEYEAGEAELNMYKQKLADGEKEYEEGVKQYEQGLQSYYAGQKALEEGQAQYDAGLKEYEAGQAELAAAKILLDEGKAQLAEGKRQLDAGKAELDAGKAKLAAGKAEYATAKALLDSVEWIYNLGLQKQALIDQRAAELAALEASETATDLEIEWARLQYDLAVRDFEGLLPGVSWQQTVADYQKALADLAAAQEEINAGQAQVDEGQAQYDAALKEYQEGEAQVAAGQAEYDAGAAKLAAGEQELRAAEAKLRAGKAELAAGEAALNDARKQLEAGEKELEDGRKQIAEGEDQLAAGKAELDSGIDTLNDNRKSLEEDLSTLDDISDKQAKLDAGMKVLRSISEVNKRVAYTDTEAEVCSAAMAFFEEELDSLNKEASLVKGVSILLIAAAAAAIVGLVLWLLKKYNVAAALVAVTTLCGIVGAAFWKMGCANFGSLSFWIALMLTVFAAIMADVLVHCVRESKADSTAELPTAEG